MADTETQEISTEPQSRHVVYCGGTAITSYCFNFELLLIFCPAVCTLPPEVHYPFILHIEFELSTVKGRQE